MKKIDLGQTLKLLGNAGVIVGILLLVYELNQNRAMIKAQTRNELSRTSVDMALYDAEDLARADLFRRGALGESLSESERWVFERRQNGWFRYWENVHYQYRNGMYDETEFMTQLETIRSLMASLPGIVEYWCNTTTTYSPEFVVEINALLPTGDCE